MRRKGNASSRQDLLPALYFKKESGSSGNPDEPLKVMSMLVGDAIEQVVPEPGEESAGMTGVEPG